MNNTNAPNTSSDADMEEPCFGELSASEDVTKSHIYAASNGLFGGSIPVKGGFSSSNGNRINNPPSVSKGRHSDNANKDSNFLSQEGESVSQPVVDVSNENETVDVKDEVGDAKDKSTQPPIPVVRNGNGLFGSTKNTSTPQPSAPSFNGKGLFSKRDDSITQPRLPSFGSGGGLFSKKDDSTPQSTPPSFVGKGLFSTKDDSTPQPPIPSFSNDGGLFSKKDDSTPQPPIPSFSNGGGLFGNKTNDSTDSKNDLADLKDTKDQSADKNDNGESTNGRDDCDNNSTDDKNDSTDAKDAKDESTPNPISDSVPLIIEEEVVSDQEIETDPIIELVSTPYVSMVELVPLPVDLLLSTADLLVEEVCSSIPVPFYQDSQSLYDELENQLLEPIYRADQNLARIAGQISSMRHSLLETRCKVKTLKKMKLDELTEDSLISSLQWGKHTREIHDQKNRLDELLRRVKDTQRLIGIMMDMVNENGMK